MICCNCIFTAILGLIIAYFMFNKFLKKPKIAPKPAVHKKDYKKDTVYLYQFPRLKKCPNLSPFCLKLETLFRTYNVPYEVVEDAKIRSRNGTLPFVELNGEHIADSDLIEVKVREHFNIPPLEPREEAYAVAITRMADNHLFNFLIRLKTDNDEFFKTILDMVKIPSFLVPVVMPLIKIQFGKKIHERVKMSIGDFEDDEMMMLLRRDLKALQDCMTGKYIFGDKITAVDATVFGQLASVYYPFESVVSHMMDNEFPRLVKYIDDIREEVFPNDFTK